jgi:hypothetical protein
MHPVNHVGLLLDTKIRATLAQGGPYKLFLMTALAEGRIHGAFELQSDCFSPDRLRWRVCTKTHPYQSVVAAFLYEWDSDTNSGC